MNFPNCLVFDSNSTSEDSDVLKSQTSNSKSGNSKSEGFV